MPGVPVPLDAATAVAQVVAGFAAAAALWLNLRDRRRERLVAHVTATCMPSGAVAIMNLGPADAEVVFARLTRDGVPDAKTDEWWAECLPIPRLGAGAEFLLPRLQIAGETPIFEVEIHWRDGRNSGRIRRRRDPHQEKYSLSEIGGDKPVFRARDLMI